MYILQYWIICRTDIILFVSDSIIWWRIVAELCSVAGLSRLQMVIPTVNEVDLKSWELSCLSRNSDDNIVLIHD